LRFLKIFFVVDLILLFLYLVAAKVPADLVLAPILKNLPGIAVSGVHGTIWTGRAASAQVTVGGKPMELGPLTWTVDPLVLLKFKACVDLHSPRLTADVCYDRNQTVYIQKGMVDQFPVKNLDGLFQIQMNGTANVTVKQAIVNLQGKVTKMDAQAVWNGTAINIGTGWHSLGSFAADVAENGEGGLLANIHDLEGDFEVDLKGMFDVAIPPKFSGVIRPKASAPQMYKDALSVYSEQQDDGSFKVTWPIGGG
jgi:hypothetical protein